MKKLGIIGCGWLGEKMAAYFSSSYEIYTTTTHTEKAERLNNLGYNVELVSFSEHNGQDFVSWAQTHHLDAVVITVPMSSRRSNEAALIQKSKNIAAFLGEYDGLLFMISSTGVYPKEEACYLEQDLPIAEVTSEHTLQEIFPQLNVLRLGGLMGADRLLKKYNISNLNAPVNHIHYQDVIRFIEFLMNNNRTAGLWNVVAPIHPSKQAIIACQNGEENSDKLPTVGRFISSKKIQALETFDFYHPDPRYFHL